MKASAKTGRIALLAIIFLLTVGFTIFTSFEKVFAQQIVGTDSSGYYYNTNETDGSQTLIDTQNPGITSLEMVGSTLYGGSSNGRLYTIDVDTGATSLIGAGNYGGYSLYTLNALGYDGTYLWGSSGDGIIMRIDMTDGSNDYDFGWYNDVYALTAMTYYNGTLYGAGTISDAGFGFGSSNCSYSNKACLYALDTSNGNHTLIGQGDYQIDSLVVQNGTMYGGNANNQFFSIDMSNGSQTLINNSTTYQLEGMAVAPEPISSTLFIVGGATLGFRRFRKKFKK